MTTILNAVGHTPLVHLKKLSPKNGAQIYAKIEGLNPTGSIKVRPALNMITKAEVEGKLTPGGTIIEVSSGNQGIALSMIGAVKGYKVIIFMPENMSEERAKIMRAYGAEIVLTPASDNIKVALETALHMAEAKEKAISGSFFVRQFENDGNPQAYEKSLALEFLSQISTSSIDAFVLGFGSGGTITGVGKVLKEKYPDLKIIIAEPENAAILNFDHRGSNEIQIGHHIQQGIGDGIIPSFWRSDLIDDAILVSDEEAITMAKRLAKEEGILCGISSGTNVYAAIRVAEKLDASKTVITVLPDSGERYLSTKLFD